MKSVLINAYACNPNWGSEPGMGWNWVKNISKTCRVFVITEGEWKKEIEAAVSLLPYKENITFFYLPVPDKVRRICWNQGDWRFYYYYCQWQKQALKLSLQIIEEHHIDIIHQLNMIGFREPGYLWKINNIPFVWGPIGGMNLYPEAYLSNLTLKESLFVKLKNRINRFQIRYEPRVQSAIKRADCLISAIPEVRDSIKDIYKKDSILISETGCNKVMDNLPINLERFEEKAFRILWVGRFFNAKQLSLALHIIAQLKSLSGLTFHIVGEGTKKQQDYYQNLAKELGIEHLCHWHGKIPNDEVHQLMRSCQLFLFTSVSEATSTVVLEALENNLPIVCFDTCGFGLVVDETVGCKVRLSTTKQSILDFSDKIKYLYNNRGILKEKSIQTVNRVEEFSWDEKMRKLMSIYEQLLNR